MSTIQRVSLSEQVLSSIINYAQEHKLQVNDKLPTEDEFSKYFQVSRTSVREAMKALSMSGAVKSIPGKGTFICSPMLDFILSKSAKLVFQANISISQFMEVRTAIELLAANLAVERATDEDIAGITEAMEELRHAILSKKSWTIQGSKFHIKIAESAKNPLIVKSIESFSDILGKYRDTMANANTEADMEEHIREHEAILNALRARDKKAIRAAVLRHLKNTEENLKRLVDKNSAIKFISK